MANPEENFWVEMSVREISTQAHFADLAYANLAQKAELTTDAVFSSIHSFLSHCAMISKMLQASSETTSIGSVLGIPANSVIHERRFRNHLEHYDERLREWIRAVGPNSLIGTYNIGPRGEFRRNRVVLIRHYDPYGSIFTFVGEDFDLAAMHAEATRVKGIADRWVNENCERRTQR